MTSSLMGLITIVIIVGMLIYFIYDPKHKRDTWKELAASLGMNYEDQDIRKGMLSAKVSGEYRGRSLLLNTIRSGNELQVLYTQIQVPVANPEGNSLSLTQRNIFTEIVKRLGVPYIPTGDDEFDQRFVIVAKPDNFMRKLFGSPYLRQKLLQIRKLDIQLVESNLNFRVRGFVNNIETLRELFDLVNEFAERVDLNAVATTSFSRN
jgi:hypothetical protein